MKARELLLFVLAAALSASAIWQEIGPHDEGLMLQAAHRVASGELPYRDFWWNYGPGQPYVLAGLERLFDRSLVPWRVLRVLLDATVALLAYRIAVREVDAGHDFAARSRWLSEGLPLLAWLAVAGAMAFPTGPGPNPAALALGLGAILVAPRRAKTAGVLAGVAAVFRPEVGAAAALGAALVGVASAGGVSAFDSLRAAGRRPATTLTAAVVVAALGWLPFAIAAPDELLDQTVGFLGIQGQQRLPFPLDAGGTGADPNKLLERYLPLLLLIGLALWLARRGALALAPLALAGLLYLLGRTDEFHLVPLAAVLPVMLVAAAARERVLALRIAAVAVVALIALHGLERKAGQLRHLPELAEVPGRAGDGVRMDAGEARELRRVLAATRGRTIFVAPPRFEQVTVGNPLLYVLAGRENPTRYDVMQPGVVTEPDVQREMVRDLRRVKPDLLIRWRDPRTRPEDNESGRARGSRVLDAYLDRAFTGDRRRIGVYELTTRR
jgi:hypothetical protein